MVVFGIHRFGCSGISTVINNQTVKVTAVFNDLPILRQHEESNTPLLTKVSGVMTVVDYSGSYLSPVCSIMLISKQGCWSVRVLDLYFTHPTFFNATYEERLDFYRTHFVVVTVSVMDLRAGPITDVVNEVVVSMPTNSGVTRDLS
ncbi:hypothetical protein DGG96_14545 [Legionella qingyii]|uniref:Uncharacterized protein n=1 Tax=Legionella qingyii TaxID=2184757 RepID=A0A317U3J6_9GAMM|nr:hypothetical protein DGG96_14545 [Legionella qingyii]